MENVCFVCGIQEETIPHLFFDCWVSSDIWGSGLLGLQIQRANDKDTIKFWEDLLQLFEDNHMVEQGMYILWMI